MASEWAAQVVGINYYPDYTTLKPLTAAAEDAEKIAGQLEQYGYRNFRTKRLPKTSNQKGESQIDPQGAVKVQELQEALANLFNPPPPNPTPETALFFFSGHGWCQTVAGKTEVFLATSDVLPEEKIYGISLSWLGEQLRKSKAKQVIVWLDCCFSGELLNFIPTDKDYCLITATRSYETGVEIAHKQGLLTRALLEGLLPEDKTDNIVNSHTLENVIKKRMDRAVQSPLIANSERRILLTTNFPKKSFQDKCPYLSLSYFSENKEDAEVFFGRSDLTQKLIDQVKNNNRLIAVLGASGSGKSSLLRAGLLYQLKLGQEIPGSDRWKYITPFTPKKTPRQSLNKAFSLSFPHLSNQGTTENYHFIPDSLKALNTPIIMLVDQLEECFTMCEESKRKDFFDRLTKLIDCTDNLCILIGMRSDFRVRLREYPEFAEKINKPYINVEQLNREEIEEAIIKPADLVGLGIEGALKQQLINDVEDYPGSLPLLQYTLTELWRESRDGILHLDTYNNLGRIEGTLQKRADEIYNSLSAEEQIVARRIFLELTQVGEITNTRRRVRLNELKNSHHSLEVLEKVSNTLADEKARLITKDSDKDSQDVILDVVHEALLRYWTQLRKWKEEYQYAIVTERKIEASAKEWKENECKKEYLFRERRLGAAEEYLDKYGNLGMLDGVAEEYIKKSQELRDDLVRKEKERKKQEEENIQRALVTSRKLARTAVVFSLIGFVFSLIVSVSAISSGYQWRNSEIGQIDALRASSKLFLLSHRQLEAVNESLRTGQLLKNSFWQKFWPDAELGNRVRKTLHKVLYTVKEGNRLQGNSPFHAVAFSPDDQTIATVGLEDVAVKLWKQDGELLEKPWLKQLSGVSAVAFRPKSQTIATAIGNTVAFWNLDGKLLAKLSKPTRGYVSAIAFSDDGKMIATASTEEKEKQQKVGIIQIWNSDNGELQKTLEGDMNNVQMSVAFSPDKQMVAASGWYGATVWKIDGTWDKTLTGQWEAVSAVTFSPDGKMIAGAKDKTVKLWQIDSKLLQTKELQTMYGHNDAVLGVSFRSDSQMIASASNDKTVKLWQIDGTLVQTLNGHKSAVQAVAFSHNDNTLASASDDGTVKLWKLGGTSLKALSHDSLVYALAFSPDSKRIITTSGHGMATLWNPDGTMIKTGKWLGGSITRVAFSPDGNTIATAAGDRTVTLRKPDGTELKYLEGHTGEINQTKVLGLSFSPDGKTIATGDVAGSVQLWNTNNGKLLKTLGKLESEVWDVSFSPNGKIIASANNDGTVKLWQSDGTLPPKTLPGHKREVFGVAFSRDGKTIASAGADGMVKLWNSDDGSLLHTLPGHSNIVSAVAFSPDDQVIASASYDGTVKLWQRDGKLLKTLSGHEGKVFGVAFSPDSKTIASAGNEDQTVILWNWEENLDLKRLLEHGCAWQRDYLNNNPEGKKNKYLCDGIAAKSDP